MGEPTTIPADERLAQFCYLPLVMREAAWFGRHMAPWVVRRVRGRSSGDGRTAKRPTLGPVLPLVREDAG